MAGRQRFSKNLPNPSQVIAKNSWVAAVNLKWQVGPIEVVFIKKVSVLTAELDTVPKKWIVLNRVCPDKENSKKETIW
jgi:hypothetical protein